MEGSSPQATPQGSRPFTTPGIPDDVRPLIDLASVVRGTGFGSRRTDNPRRKSTKRRVRLFLTTLPTISQLVSTLLATSKRDWVLEDIIVP